MLYNHQKVLLLLLAACGVANTHGARALKTTKSRKSEKKGKKGKKKSEAPSMEPSMAPSTVPSMEPSTAPSMEPSISPTGACDPIEVSELQSKPDDIVAPYDILMEYGSESCPQSLVDAVSFSDVWRAIEEEVTQLEFNAGFMRGCYLEQKPFDSVFPNYLRLYLCGYDVLLTLSTENKCCYLEVYTIGEQ